MVKLAGFCVVFLFYLTWFLWFDLLILRRLKMAQSPTNFGVTNGLSATHRLSPLGEYGAVLECTAPTCLAGQKKIWAFAQRILTFPNVKDVVPGMNNVSVMLAAGAANVDELMPAMSALWAELQTDATRLKAPRKISIPVQYGGAVGADLAWVAEHAKLSVDEVIQLHSQARYTVFFMGFLPGFAYLDGLDARLHTPRKTTPSTNILAGSVGIGGSQTGIYPLTSPGGWQIIGHTPLVLFDAERNPSSLLQAGDVVQFVPM
jgi:KipI family sensor histidine kinase inhibitor